MQLVTLYTDEATRTRLRANIFIHKYLYIHTPAARDCRWGGGSRASMWASVGGGSTAAAAAAVVSRGSCGVCIQPLRSRKKGGGVGPPTAAVQEGRDEDSESVALSAPPDSPGLAC